MLRVFVSKDQMGRGGVCEHHTQFEEKRLYGEGGNRKKGVYSLVWKQDNRTEGVFDFAGGR